MKDIRDEIFQDVFQRQVSAVILSDDRGVIAGTGAARKKALELGLIVVDMMEEGRAVQPGDVVARFTGRPKQIAMAEDLLMGCMAKPSGVATAAKRCVAAAGGKKRIVCGSWKKMPLELKDALRNAVSVGGAFPRICNPPFIYLDKNYVRMLGGIKQSLQAASRLARHKKVLQIRGEEHETALEAIAAACCGADIIYVDSGNPEDITSVSTALNSNGLRKNVEIAFGGNVRFEDIQDLKSRDADILAIGKDIIDGPLLDLKMEVIDIKGERHENRQFCGGC